ncbi:MAG: hypothetical protein H7Z72_22470 [Bacteroidetes bacterium]|nr:hypothetical protein [Fibrella sp.]
MATVNPLGKLYGNALKRVPDGTGRKVNVLDLRGKKLPAVPELIWNVQASYSRRRIGLDARLNYVGRRFQDLTNIIRGRVQVQNLFNSTTLTRMLGNEADQALGQKQVNPDFARVVGAGCPMLPRRIIYSIGYSF